MKIEALEDIRSGNFTLTAGDIVTVPDEDGTHWCEMGWAKDTAGVVPTGERSVLPRTMSIGASTLSASARV